MCKIKPEIGFSVLNSTVESRRGGMSVYKIFFTFFYFFTFLRVFQCS